MRRRPCTSLLRTRPSTIRPARAQGHLSPRRFAGRTPASLSAPSHATDLPNFDRTALNVEPQSKATFHLPLVHSPANFPREIDDAETCRDRREPGLPDGG